MSTLRFKVAPVWKGTWDAQTTYDVSDEVASPDGSGNYRSLIASNTQPLTNTAAWLCIFDTTHLTEVVSQSETLNTQMQSNESDRQAAEATRETHETTRVANESERVSRENSRINSETNREDAETNRRSAENTRVTNENNRTAAESTRVSAENTRVNNENTRNANELTRRGNEETRVNNESTRVSHEETRVSNEGTRQSNESTRQSNEQTRQTNEGSASDEPSATGSRWARYKKAEQDRNTSYGVAEGSDTDAASASGSRWARYKNKENQRQNNYETNEGQSTDTPAADGSRWARFKKAEEARDALVNEKVGDITRLQEEKADTEALENGNIIPAMAETLAPWADQKAIATPDTYTDAVRTTGGDIPIETSAGSKLESIKPVAGIKWTAKLLFNGSYNMLNAAKWGAANSQPYVGGVGNDFVYFLVPELTLGTFGTADENNGLLFTDSEGENVQPTSVYYKPLGSTVPQSLTDGTSVSPTSVSYDGKTYKDYATSGAGWLIIPKTYYDNDVCAHIAWEDWYDKHVSLDEPNTNPEAVVGTLMLEGLLALAHSDKYLRGVNDEVFDNVVFGDTSATVTHMVDELSVAANAWTNAATGESDSQGNALYRHSATVSLIKQGGAACVEGEDGGIPLTVNGTTVSYIDTNATAPASTVFYEVTATSTTKAYTDSVFSGSNIDVETGVLPINDCSIEAQIAMDGEANITVKYAKNIVDQVAINATVDVPQIKEQVENHEERITDLEDTAVRTGSYDASVAVGLADNFKGDTIVDAEFYKRKTGGTQSVGSGIAAIKEMRGKSIVWNQLVKNGNFVNTNDWYASGGTISASNNILTYTVSTPYDGQSLQQSDFKKATGHKFLVSCELNYSSDPGFTSSNGMFIGVAGYWGYTYTNPVTPNQWFKVESIVTDRGTAPNANFLIYLRTQNMNIGDTIRIKNVLSFDLTLMFGAGNEPTTVEEFEKMFPLDYYDYNEGEVIPFAGQNLVTTGFNQWDEQWEVGEYDYNNGSKKGGSNGIRSKGFIPISPNMTYYCKNGSVSSLTGTIALFYDSNKTFLTGIGSGEVNYIAVGNAAFTTPNNAKYMVFYTAPYIEYNNDICINISNPDRNGTYEPYEKHTLPLDPSQWRDKQGNLVFPYGGMHGVGTAYDYAKVDADGYIRSVVRRFGQVDLGSLRYDKVYTSDVTVGFWGNVEGGITGYSEVWSAINPKYEYIGTYANNLTTIDKVCYKRGSTSCLFTINDSSYTDAATFKAAMQGVPLIYELAEPIEVELATPIYAKYLVDKDGTEEITPANGTIPYTTMANISVLYAMDARGEIKNLPKNYLSKESTENMLNAMVSAGVIASYTMTYDAANGRYAFVITAPVEPEENTQS